MSNESPVPVLCRYRVKPGKEERFGELLREHWSVISSAGYTTEEPSRVHRAEDAAGNVAWIETFTWKSRAAIDSAHESPDVIRFWEPMGALCEDMEFWHLDAGGA